MPASGIEPMVDNSRLCRRMFVIPVTSMLAFVSFWRASAIVLCDLGSSAYYVGGIAEQAIGKAAPWFILAVMLFSYAVRAVYIESCSMFVRGGVYRVVRQAMGTTAAKFSVSALLFDYVLTGPISGVSAGLYLAALINELGQQYRLPWLHVPAPWFAAVFAALVTVYFWYTNRIGIPFSSTKALRIMQVTTVMVVILIAWSVTTILVRGFQPVPAPVPSNLHFSDSSLGWLRGTVWPSFTAIAILVGLGHSVLALSGEETLAQVFREIEAPKQKNLQRTGFIIFIYSLAFTSLVSFFAVMLIPDQQRSHYLDNLIGGLSRFLIGPAILRLIFHGFVVLVGVLILSGAVNTAIIGCNGVLNRIAEDGVLPPQLRQPHPKHGTTCRLINLIVALQLITILLSRGDVTKLGEAYAFGVVWSFAMKGLAVVVLRFRYPDAQRWRFPLNVRLGKLEIPLGLIGTTLMLFLMATINLFTKTTATVSGCTFTVLFFIAFTLSERRYASAAKAERINNNTAKKDPFREAAREHLRLETCHDLSPETLQVRPGCVLVGIEHANDLRALDGVFAAPSSDRKDIVVLSINDRAGSAQADAPQKIIDQDKTDLFSEIIFSAEKQGRPVRLAALSAPDRMQALFEVGSCLQASEIWIGAAPTTSERQDRSLREAWSQLPSPRPSLVVSIVKGDETPPRWFRPGEEQAAAD